MHGIFDWVTVGMFAIVAVLFLHRSVGPERPGDRTWHYIPPALGCAVGNALGNDGHVVIAIAVLVLTAVYIVLRLRPVSLLR